MKRFSLAVVAMVSVLFNACGTSPLQACKDQSAVECKKMWSCPGSPLKLGSDEATCVSFFNALCTQVENGQCPKGGAYPIDKVVACTADIEKQTCEQYVSGTAQSENCKAAECK